MDDSLSQQNFNYYEPFDTSSLIKCRNSSTFLISMKSPSLQKISHNKRFIKTANKTEKQENSSDFDEVSRLRGLIFNENKETQYQRILEEKSNKIGTLQCEVRRLKKENSINSFNNNANNTINNNNNVYESNNEGYDEAIQMLKQNLQYSIDKCKGTFKTMISRNNQFSELISLIDSFKRQGINEFDIVQLRSTLQSISGNILASSSKDLELSEALKLLQEKNHENVRLSARYEKLQARCEFFERKLQEVRFQNTSISEDLKQKRKDLHNEEAKSSEQGKKLLVLSKTLKVLNAKDSHLLDKSNYKTVINELVKETEGLRRSIINKDKEIEHLQEINTKLRNKSSNLAKKLEILQMNLNQNAQENQTGENSILDEEKFSLLNEMKLPPVLDYRTHDLSPIISNLLLDIENQGPEAIFKHLTDQTDGPEDRAEILRSVSKQYASFREFAESINSLIFHMHKIIEMSDLPDLLSYLYINVKKVFRAENLRLWIDDKMTGVLYSYNEKRQMVRSVNNRGYLGKIYESGIALNKISEKNLFLCEIITETEFKKIYVDGVLLIPLGQRGQKLKGILEISGWCDKQGTASKIRGLDYEYYGIVIGSVLKAILYRFSRDSISNQERRLKQMWQDSLIDLCSSVNDFAFSSKIHYWAERIFNVSACQFLFHEKNKLIRHLSNTNFEEFSDELGVAGLVTHSKKPSLIYNLKNSPNFDSHVDLATLMSVLTFPINENVVLEGVKEKNCLGILQVPLKDAGKVRFEKDGDWGEIRENVESLANFFGRMLELGFKYYRRNL